MPKYRKILSLKNKKPQPDSAVSASPVTHVAINRKTPVQPALIDPPPKTVSRKPKNKIAKPSAPIPVNPKPLSTPHIPRFVKIAATLTLLRETFPQAFTEPFTAPFAVGIRQKAHKALKQKANAEGSKVPASKNLIGQAIELYKNIHPEYALRLQEEGAQRIGLEGEPCGIVTAEHIRLEGLRGTPITR